MGESSQSQQYNLSGILNLLNANENLRSAVSGAMSTQKRSNDNAETTNQPQPKQPALDMYEPISPAEPASRTEPASAAEPDALAQVLGEVGLEGFINSPAENRNTHDRGENSSDEPRDNVGTQSASVAKATQNKMPEIVQIETAERINQSGSAGIEAPEMQRNAAEQGSRGENQDQNQGELTEEQAAQQPELTPASKTRDQAKANTPLVRHPKKSRRGGSKGNDSDSDSQSEDQPGPSTNRRIRYFNYGPFQCQHGAVLRNVSTKQTASDDGTIYVITKCHLFKDSGEIEPYETSVGFKTKGSDPETKFTARGNGIIMKFNPRKKMYPASFFPMEESSCSECE